MAPRRHGWVRNLLVTSVAGSIALFPFWRGQRVPVLTWVDFAVHETGHLLAGWLPSLVMFMAGSAVEIGVPLVLGIYFAVSQRDLAASGLCLAWSGAAAWGVSVYAGDAVVQSLPIVGGEHDWAYILGPEGFDALSATAMVSRAIEIGGLVLAGVGILIAIWSTVAAVRPEAYMVTTRAEFPSSPAPAEVDPWRAAARHPGGGV